MKLDKLQEAYDEMFDFITDLPSGLDGFESDFDAAYKELLEAKSADVAPVVHGKWIEVTRSVYYGMDKQGNPIYRDRSVYYCSECNRKTVIKEKYCPDCGAKMDLED